MNERRASELTHEEEAGLVARLRAERAELSPLELDRIKTTIMARTRGSAPRRLRPLRAAALALFSTGILATAAGATVGVEALTGDVDSAGVQYVTDTPPQNPPIAGPPPDEQEQRCPPGDNDGECAGIKGEIQFGGDGPGDRTELQPTAQPPLQPTGQVTRAGGGSLAFTGYLAIPLLAIGLLLTTIGVSMRRQGER